MEQYGCNGTCQQVFPAGQSSDRELFGEDFDFDFYATSPEFYNSKPGDLLKFEPMNPAQLDVMASMSAYRFQYTSQDLNGSLVPVTGFIALPYTSYRPDNKLPVIAYAHGTIGIFRGCPPSTTPSLYDYTSWSLLTQRGYALVATDYAGLGNDYIPHRYLTFPAHANDVYNSMLAARKAFPDLFTDEWMSAGHSQGGGTAWKLSESLPSQDTEAGKYLGTVALAPASKIYNMASLGSQILFNSPDYDQYDITYELTMLPLALQRVFPNASTAALKTDFLDRIALAERTQSCYTGFLALAYGLKPSDIFESPTAIQSSSELKEWQDMVAPANGGRSVGPLLIVQGSNDTAVLPQTTQESFNDTCQFGNQAHLSMYPEMDHSDLLVASATEWIGFIDDRFAHPDSDGVSGDGCTTVTRTPFYKENMVTVSEVSGITGS